jgi:hypothetical protein
MSSGYALDLAKHTEWLSRGIHVPDEHLWYFEGVDRDESEFEKQYQVFVNLNGLKQWINASDNTYNDYPLQHRRIVAIPKEESKLTNLDHWFVATLKSLIGAEEYMVKRGIKKEIDRNILSAWVKRHSSNINEEQEDSPIGSEIGIWLQSQLRFFTSIEGEIVKVSDYAGGLSIKFKNGNGYTLKLSKQCQVSADEFPRESTTTRRG